MIYNPFIVIGIPIILCCFFSSIFYDVELSFFKDTYALFFMFICMTVFLGQIIKFCNINANVNCSDIRKNKNQNFYAIIFGFFVLLFCMLDLYLRGPTLFINPGEYYIFSPVEKYVRYVSIMCWSLIPIGLFCTNNKIIKAAFVLVAILFPLLAVDRNRLFSSFYVLFVSFIIINKEKIHQFFSVEKMAKFFLPITVMFMCLFLLFSFIGNKRSNIYYLLSEENYVNQKSNLEQKKIKFEKLKDIDIDRIPILKPKESIFQNSPTSLIWFLLYSTSSIFNFSVIYNISYKDPDYLNYQIFRLFSSDVPSQIDDLTPLPLPLPALTVGTEFLPFLLYGEGILYVIISFTLICLIYFLYMVLFSKFSSSIFMLLGFLKLSYCCIMLGFAPQFFTLTNIGFLSLMILIHTATLNLINIKGLRWLARRGSVK